MWAWVRQALKVVIFVGEVEVTSKGSRPILCRFVNVGRWRDSSGSSSIDLRTGPYERKLAMVWRGRKDTAYTS
jgi:hypothetical protein